MQYIAGFVVFLSLSAFAYLLIDYLNNKERPEEEEALPLKPRLRVRVREGRAVPVEPAAVMAVAAYPEPEVVAPSDRGLYVPPEYSLEHAIATEDIVAEAPCTQVPVQKNVLPSMPEHTPVLPRMPVLPVKPAVPQSVVPLPTPARKRPPRRKTEPRKVTPQSETQTSIAHIGYQPVSLFEQNEPLQFPYVVLPRSGSIIKYPRKGRAGRRHCSEAAFKSHVVHYFSDMFTVSDDSFILTRRSYQPYEPDLVLVRQEEGLNLFMAIEIDEPYQDSNAVSSRELSHYRYADVNSNRALANRGWVVIRFAEEQVHRHPESCCLFIAHVVQSLWPEFELPETLPDAPLRPLKQWSREEAARWSDEKWREQYLGIPHFESFTETVLTKPVTETDLGAAIEAQVQDEEPFFEPEPVDLSTTRAMTMLVHSVISHNQCLSFVYEGAVCLVKPWIVVGHRLKAYCYIENQNREFDLRQMQAVVVKEKPFVLELKGPVAGIERIRQAVRMALQYQRRVRICYTRAPWTGYLINEATGEVLLDETEAEESLRTLWWKDGALSEDEEVIEAYCSEEEGPVRFQYNRICGMAVLGV